VKYTITITEKALSLAAALNTRQLIDQLLCPNFTVNSELGDRAAGAAFFHPDEKDHLRQRIATFKANCAIAPLIVTDMESGPGGMIKGATRFPSMLGCGTINDPELAYRMGVVTAREGREAGFNWTFSPVADLIAAIDNPITNTRSAGADPARVIEIISAYIRGLQENGLAACAKHFPGDGFDVYDQHLTTSVNPLSQDEWRKRSGRVFREVIERGVMTIMPGHIALPAFDEKDPDLGLYPPATLSANLKIKLLKGELGFDGIIVSDAINMAGVVGFKNYYDACALFWETGGDILLFPTVDSHFYNELQRRIDSGLLTLETLRSRAARVLAFKEQMGLFGPPTPAPLFDRSEHEQLARRMSRAAVQVARDRNQRLPLRITPATKILHVVLSNSARAASNQSVSGLTDALGKCAAQVTEMTDPGPDKLFELARNREYDLIVCSINAQGAYGTSSARLYGPVARNMMHGWMKLDTPVVFVLNHNPFVVHEFDACMDTVINTYGPTQHTPERVVEVITGMAGTD
jgi:beta-N-acetylhexosaminidase